MLLTWHRTPDPDLEHLSWFITPYSYLEHPILVFTYWFVFRTDYRFKECPSVHSKHATKIAYIWSGRLLHLYRTNSQWSSQRYLSTDVLATRHIEHNRAKSFMKSPSKYFACYISNATSEHNTWGKKVTAQRISDNKTEKAFSYIGCSINDSSNCLTTASRLPNGCLTTA